MILLGRWTETSFIVMLPATVGSAARRIFERIFAGLSQPVSMEQYDITIMLDPKVGGAVYSNEITFQELLDKVASALDQSRRDSVDFVKHWETGELILGSERRQIVHALKSNA